MTILTDYEKINMIIDHVATSGDRSKTMNVYNAIYDGKTMNVYNDIYGMTMDVYNA